MNYKLSMLSLLLWATVFSVRAQDHFKCNDGVVEFNSNAPLEIINATSNELTGLIDASNKSFGFIVQIRSFEGFNASLQRDHFNENYMESAKFPYATFKGKIIEEVDFSEYGETTVRAKGVLAIHGIEQERIIKSVLHISPDTLKVVSIFSVLLSDHDIRIPRIVNEKIAKEIEVMIKADLVRQ